MSYTLSLEEFPALDTKNQGMFHKHNNLVTPDCFPDLDMNRGMYTSLWQQGIGHYIILRDESKSMKGYCFFFLISNPHYMFKKMATVDAFYICPDFAAKNKSAGREMEEFLELASKELGACLLLFQTTSKYNIGSWLLRRGYEPNLVTYTKGL